MINMLSAFEVSQANSIERPRERSANSDSASLFSKILNFSCQPKQDYSQPQSSEHNFRAKTSTAADAANIKMDNSKASYTPVQRSQSEQAQHPAAPQVKDNSSNSSEVKKPDETDERPIDSARQNIHTKKAETESGDATTSKETTNDEPSRPQLVSQPRSDSEATIQRNPQVEEKPLIEFFNFKENKIEPAIQNNPIRISDEKSPLRSATPAFVNIEDVEVLSENAALGHQQVVRSAKNFEDSGQPTFLNLSLESEKKPESSNIKREAPKQADAPIFKNISSAEEKVALRSANAPPLNPENIRQFVTDQGSGSKKDTNSQLLNINRNIDILTPALLKGETLTTQTVMDKGAQSTLRAVELVEGIKEKIMLMVRGSDERAVFKLNPPELGRLEIRLELQDKSCRAEILVQNPVVKALIETHSSDLVRGLQNANLELTNLSVSFESDGDKRESVNEGAQFSKDEKIKEVNPIKKQSAQTQRVNMLSDTSVDIVI